MGEGARDVQIPISYEDSHGLYADAMRRAIRGHRHGAEVAARAIAELGLGAGGFDLDLVVSSHPNTVAGEDGVVSALPRAGRTVGGLRGGRRRVLKNPGVWGCWTSSTRRGGWCE